MKALMIAGTRSKEGQTARALDAYAAGCMSTGAEVETIFLPELDIRVCNQCGADNWGTCKSRGICCIKDDLNSVITKIREADAVVFVTPVFYSDVSESIQAFTRRLRRTTSNENGKVDIAGKRAAVIAVAGSRGKGAAACCGLLEEMLVRTGFDVIDLQPIRKQNLDAKISTLTQAGAWFASTLLGEE